MNCKNLTNKSKPCESINKFTTATWVFFWNLLKLLKTERNHETSAATQLQLCHEPLTAGRRSYCTNMKCSRNEVAERSRVYTVLAHG